MLLLSFSCSFFFFNDTATTEIYTLSLHDALPIYLKFHNGFFARLNGLGQARDFIGLRSEEHTSELQSRGHLVCRLLLEKKKNLTISIETLILLIKELPSPFNGTAHLHAKRREQEM